MQENLFSQDCRVLVLGLGLGLGQLGRYHAEASARSALRGEVWGFDASEKALSAPAETDTGFPPVNSIASG